jgi:hypothetical protein
VPQQLEVTIFALGSVALLVATHYLWRRTVRKFGPIIIRPIVHHLIRPILTIYYRRKVIKQIQAERKAKGVPPLENQHTL